MRKLRKIKLKNIKFYDLFRSHLNVALHIHMCAATLPSKSEKKLDYWCVGDGASKRERAGCSPAAFRLGDQGDAVPKEGGQALDTWPRLRMHLFHCCASQVTAEVSHLLKCVIPTTTHNCFWCALDGLGPSRERC
jgi:hypothetical protein